MSKIVITTPTGHIGSVVLKNLVLSENNEITVIARDPGKIPDEFKKRIQIVQGDLKDPDVLNKALSNADSLFWCIPPPDRNANSTIQEHYKGISKLLAKSIGQTKLKRAVTISSGGKGIAENGGYITALHLMEDILNETGIAFKHLRTGSHMENLLNQLPAIIRTHKISTPLSRDIRLPLVAARDIGSIAAEFLNAEDWNSGDNFAVYGPEDISFTEAADLMSECLEIPIHYEPINPEQFEGNIIRHSGNTDLAKNLLDMYTQINAGIYISETPQDRSNCPTTLDIWLKEVFKPAYLSQLG